MHRSVDAPGASQQAGLSPTPGLGVQGVIAPETHMGTVRLTVADLSRVRSFYEQVLGLQIASEDEGRVALGAPGGPGLVELLGDGAAAPRDARAPGLFHMALLLPDRPALAMALARLSANRWPLDGASDHLVSEALYLSDPEGNGIEIYRDRPREQWQVRDGHVAMATLPLDLENLMAELGAAERVESHAPAGMTMGHVHLQVSDLDQAEEFYAGVLGFEVTVRAYPGALFVSAGGYHHHLGLNTWHSAGSPPAASGSAGLRNFDVVLPSEPELSQVLDRVHGAGLETQAEAGGSLVRDPFGNGVLLRVT